MVGVEDVYSTEELVGSTKSRAFARLIHSTSSGLSPRPLSQEIEARFSLRLARTRPIRLHRFPAGTILLGATFWISVDGQVLDTPIYPGSTSSSESFSALLATCGEAIDVEQESVCISRWGWVTWGHWFCELLTKAVMLEATFPGRFNYIVPSDILLGNETLYNLRLRESLAFYGIQPNRLIPIRPDQAFRFSSLYDVSGTSLQDDVSPELLVLIPGRPRERFARNFSKLAAIRSPVESRCLNNHSEVVDALREQGYACVNLLSMTFSECVRAFQHCESYVSTWGSELAWLAAMRPGGSLLTLAPARWRDMYFACLINAQSAIYADLRLPALWSHESLERDAPMYLPLSTLRQSLTKLVASHPPVSEVNELAHLSFSAGGSGLSATRGAGWSQQEKHHIWTVGDQSAFEVSITPASGKIFIIIELSSPPSSPPFTCYPLFVAVNDSQAIYFEVAEAGRICVPHVISMDDRTIRVTLTHPLNPSPRAQGLSEDDRRLGFAVKEIQVLLVGGI